jgi:hypothetical protein
MIPEGSRDTDVLCGISNAWSEKDVLTILHGGINEPWDTLKDILDIGRP